MSFGNTEITDRSPHRFGELVDVAAFARMLESFFQATGIPNGVVDASGELLSLSAGVNACTEFHRVQPEAAEGCRQSNLAIMHDLRDGHVAGGRCENGLMDYATPVVIEGQQLATLFLGQVLHEPPDLDFFRAQAARFGFDEKAYLESIKAIPVVDKARIQDLMGVMVEMAKMLAASGLARIHQLALYRDINMHVERCIQIEDIWDFSPVALGWLDGKGRIEHINREFTQLFGYTLDELPDLETANRLLYPDEQYRETIVIPWIKTAELARQNNTTLPDLEADITCKNGAVRRVVVRVSWVGPRRLVSFTDITELKRAEQSLKQALEFTEGIINAIPDLLFEVDLNGKYLSVWTQNPALLAAQKEALLGNTIRDVLLPDAAKIAMSAIEEADRNGFSFGKVIRIQLPQGESWFELSVSRKPGPSQSDRHFIVLSRDVTERKRLELQLAVHERELRSLVENIPDNIARHTPDARYVYMSPVMERTIDKLKEFCLGKTPMECFPDGRYAEFERRVRAVAASGSGDEMEMPVPMPDGTTEYHSIRFFAEHDEKGTVVSVLTIGTDITQRKQLELALAASEREMRGLVENIPDNIARYTPDARHVYMSPVLERVNGKPKEYFLGRTPMECFPDGRYAEYERRILATAATGGHDEMEMAVPMPDGETQYHLIRFVAERDKNGNVNSVLTIGTDITARKRLEQELAERERDFRSLAENLPDNVARWDTEGRYIYLNPTHEHTIGQSSDALLGTRIPESHTQVRAAIAQAVATGRAVYSVHQPAVVDGAEVLHDVSIVPEFDANGNVVSVLGLGRDMTDVYRLQETIVAREHEFRSLAESSPDLIIRVDRDLRIRYLNANMVKFLELGSAEEVIGRQSIEVWPDGRFNEIDALRERVVTAGEMESVELAVPIAGGKTAYHHIVTVPERDTTGHIIGTLTFGRNITERKRMEQALAAREREFRTLAQNLSDFMVRYDRDARFVYANPIFEAAFGIRSEEVHGKTPTQVPGIPQAEFFEQNVRKVAESGTALEFEHEVVTADGVSIWGLVRFTPEFDNAGQVNYVQVMTRDITQRWISEQRIQAHGVMLEMVARGADLSAILNALVRQLESEDKTARCSVLLLDAEGKRLLTGAAPSLPAFYNQAIHGIEIGMGVGSCGTAASLGERVVVEDILTHDYWKPYLKLAQEAELRACWSEPILSSHGKVLGAFAIYHAVPKRPQAADLERIAFAANLAAIAIENRDAHEELEHRAYTDYLTGLANRRHFLEQAENELARTLRYGRELSILMLDVDRFKQVNDTYGHKVGDLVLQKLSETCLAALRDVDIAGRIGGEEFAMLLPETGDKQAMQAAERLRAAIAAAQVVLSSGLPLHFTASIGVATLKDKEANIDTLLNQADQALYRAKNEGRNRVHQYRVDDEDR